MKKRLYRLNVEEVKKKDKKKLDGLD
jgi:hypothetical protein